MMQPRANQSPEYAWPNSLVVTTSAIAQATSMLRIVAGAVIAPLRHPLLLAKVGTLDLLSQGRRGTADELEHVRLRPRRPVQ